MVRDEDKQTRHSAKMEYNVTTMVHARSEVIGSSGEKVPRYVVDPAIILEEEGDATIHVIYANVPCSGGIFEEDGVTPRTHTSDVTANFFVESSDAAVGVVPTGTGTGPSYTFAEGDRASVHVSENVNCSSVNGQEQMSDNGNTTNIRFTTNDNSEHTKLNDIIPNPSSTIVSKLTEKNFIKKAADGSYDFTLPDNIVLYFVEFAFDQDNLVFDETLGKFTEDPQNDPPHFDDYIYFVEMTK